MIGIVVALIAVVLAVVVIAAIAGVCQRPVNRTGLEAAMIIRSFLNGAGGAYDWDDFICGARNADPEVEAARVECAELPSHFPPQAPGHYCGPEGLAALERLVIQLEARRDA